MMRTGKGKASSKETKGKDTSSPVCRRALALQQVLDRAKNNLQDRPDEEYKGVKRDLGLPQSIVAPMVTVNGSVARFFFEVLSFLIALVEWPFFWLLGKTPDPVVRVVSPVMVWAFHFLVKVWSWMPAPIRCCGVGESLSTEAHLMTLLMWPARLLPMTLRRMRFGMSNLCFFQPPLPGIREEIIDEPERGVKGIYLHTAPEGVEDPPVLLWFFGGAFFAGDTVGNRGLGARFAAPLGADVFIADYRLLPEGSFQDATLDAARAYEWLLTRKDASKIYTAGISAGAGILLRALQLAKSNNERERRWAFYGTSPTPQPRCALLLGPFVDWSIPDSDSSTVRNSALDWIVTQRVLELTGPVFCKIGGSQEGLKQLSPLFKDLSGLCPMFISYSLHEATTDMCAELVNRLRAAGNQVETWTTPYLGHVFQVLTPFLPEARQSEQVALRWIQKHLSA